MRTRRHIAIAFAAIIVACVSPPVSGALNDGSPLRPQITAIDTTHPPSSAWVQIDQPTYAALLLVIPGHSATLLYPPDSAPSNQLTPGAHLLHFTIPQSIARPDTAPPRRTGADSGRIVTRRRPSTVMPPVPATAPIYLLLITSPQQLDYGRIVAKTTGVSIPTVETEALNAVAKAVKSTLANEPREWSAFYHRIEVQPSR